MRTWSKFVGVWEAWQVELHGKYSVERLVSLELFSLGTSNARALAVMFATLLPSLLCIVLIELIPLEAAKKGLAHSEMFWVRVLIMAWIIAFAVLEQCRRIVPMLRMTTKQILLVTTLAAVGTLGFMFGLACAIGFPIPFAMLLASPMGNVILSTLSAFIWGERVRGDREIQSRLANYALAMSTLIFGMYIYSAYNHFFGKLTSFAQATFALLLPVLKIAFKNLIAYLFRGVEDLKPELVIFNIEVFHALFITYSMQQSNSLYTTFALIAVDFAQTCAALHDANEMSKALHDLFPIVDEILSIDKQRIQENPDIRFRSAARDTNVDAEERHGLPSASDAIVDLIVAHSANLSTDDRRRLEAISEVRRLEFLRRVLQLLHFTEFLLLVEFTEVIVPMIYYVYLAVVSHLPNRQFYANLRDLDAASFQHTISTVLLYACLEALSFALLATMASRKLGISPLKQLAFVLEKQWQLVQSKLLLWVLFSVQTSLDHFGVDFSFRFAWLH